MASIALTTVLTPPASCFDNSYTLFGGSVYEKDISIAFTECYPSGYHSLFTEAIPYSPGVCPASYTIATQSAYTGNAGATAAVCCPTGFDDNEGGLGCHSIVTASTTLVAPDGPIIVASGAELAVHGVYIVLGAATSVASSTSLTTAPSTTVQPSPASSSSDPPEPPQTTSATIVVSASSSEVNQTSTTRTSSSSSSASASSDTSALSRPATSTSVITSVTYVQSSTATSAASPSSSISATAASGPTATITPEPPHGLSNGAKAGIGVGAAIVGLVVIGLLTWRLMARRGNNANDAEPMNDGMRSWPSEADFRKVLPDLQGG